MQEDLNIYLDPKWKSANYDFRLAASQELSELIDHLPWKWWKASKPVDMAQAKLEVVDITHFIIADMLKYFNTPELVARLILDTKTKYDEHKARQTSLNKGWDVLGESQLGIKPLKKTEIQKYDQMIKETFKLQARLVNCSTLYLPDVLIELWDLYNLELHEIAKIYFSKNTLNIFRYKHGYREGSYIKIWNGFEDNVILDNITNHELADHDWTDPNTRTELYKLLEKKYNNCWHYHSLNHEVHKEQA